MLNYILQVNAFMGKETIKIEEAGVIEIKKIPRNALGNVSESCSFHSFVCHFLSFSLP
jgi:hypothetical protein